MRVIRNGVEITEECAKCRSTLGVAPEDVHDCNAFGTWFVCPVCGSKNTLNTVGLPPLFKLRVKWDDPGH